jgi:hypothetical protein
VEVRRVVGGFRFGPSARALLGFVPRDAGFGGADALLRAELTDPGARAAVALGGFVVEARAGVVPIGVSFRPH